MTKYVFALLFSLLALPAFAQDQDVSAAEQPAIIARIETYLNSITTLQAHFAQQNNDGTLFTGTFYLWRPGRLRFQYDPPNGDYIVADGLLVNYWDAGTKNASNAPIGSTLADFLLRKRITLSRDLKIVSIRRPAPDRLLVTMVQAATPEAGDLRLLFAENPQDKKLRLEKWRVTDATGQVTEVTLSNAQTGIKLNPSLFRFQPPKGYENLNQ